MRRGCVINWPLIVMIIFCAAMFYFTVVGFKHVVFGAEPPGLEPVIVWEDGRPTVEVWTSFGNHKQKVWDDRPGRMKESSKTYFSSPRSWSYEEDRSWVTE